jgi:hypothetical protein
MEHPVGPGFREQIAEFRERLSRVSEEQAQTPFRDGGWTKKEILGHLIDSALNTHQRFVRASLEGSYRGPSYEQQGWVAMHGYGSMPWSVLMEHWFTQNALLCEVVDRIPNFRLDAPCLVGEDTSLSLRSLVKDYLVHLRHHIDQIVPPASASSR